MLAHFFRFFRLGLGRRRLFRLILRFVLHQIEDAHLLARGFLLERAQVFVRCDRLAAAPAVRRGVRVLPRLVLAGRFGVQRDVNIRFAAAGAAFLSLLRVCRCNLMHIGQLGRRLIIRALFLILIFVCRRAEHLHQRLRRDAAGRQNRRNSQQQQHDQRPHRGQRPFEHNIQPAGQQTARVPRHAGLHQVAQRPHGKIIRVCAGKGVDDAANQHRQRDDAGAAQAHRPFFPREEQPCQRQQRKRQQIAAHADDRADAAMHPDEQRAVNRQNGQQAKQSKHCPDRAPRSAGHHCPGLGRALSRLPAARRGFCRFFACSLFCSQRCYPRFSPLLHCAAAQSRRQPVPEAFPPLGVKGIKARTSLTFIHPD